MPVILLQTVGSVLLKTLMQMGAKLLTEDMCEWVILWGAEKLAAKAHNKDIDALLAKAEATLRGQSAQ